MLFLFKKCNIQGFLFKMLNNRYILYMIQVYKEVFKARAFNVASALKTLINVYHMLFFIIPALQSETYNKKSKLKYLFRSNPCH
jgi:phosphotransferase system  glucose/maltose/N-acetylglucosamine-specific IIC component